MVQVYNYTKWCKVILLKWFWYAIVWTCGLWNELVWIHVCNGTNSTAKYIVVLICDGMKWLWKKIWWCNCNWYIGSLWFWADTCIYKAMQCVILSFQAIEGSKLIMIQDASHMVMMEQPDHVNALLQDLLNRGTHLQR
jgi:carboxypeptidase C (cathepsin A)